TLLVAKPEAAGVQGLDHLVDRLLAEVRDRVQLRLRLRDQITDGLDAGPLEAVVGPHTELQLLDQDVVHRVGLPGGRAHRSRPYQAGLQSARNTGFAKLYDAVRIGEDRELGD